MNRIITRLAAAGLLAVCGTAASGAVSHAYPGFTPAPTGVTSTWRNQNLNSLANAPNATYVGYKIDVDWVGGNAGSSSTQWANEARGHFGSAGGTGTGSTPTGAGTAYTTAARLAQNGAANDFNVTPLRFRGGFNANYTQTGASPLFLNYRQSFAGSNANWSNVRVTIFDNIDDALGVTDLGTISSGTTTSTAAYSRTDSLRWYKFVLGSGVSATDFLTVETYGNTLSGGTFGALDTYLALYNAAGAPVVTNDDHTNAGSRNESLIIAGSLAASPYPAASGFGNAGATLAAGTYYLAVAPYSLTAGSAFDASGSISQLVAGTDLTGSFQINIKTNVPTPGGFALLALGGVIAGRRRR